LEAALFLVRKHKIATAEARNEVCGNDHFVHLKLGEAVQNTEQEQKWLPVM